MKVIATLATVAAGLAVADDGFCCYYPLNDCDNCVGKTTGQPESWCTANWCPAGPAPTTPPTNPPQPTPAPPPTAPTPVPKTPLWCPEAKDLTVAYGSGTQLMDGGWVLSGNTGAATKAAFNMVGGYAEYDIDFTHTPVGVNANIYTISPNIGADGYKGTDYCDGADNDQPWCTEVDWIESNGNCGGATTLHTKPGPGQFCGSWGCRSVYHYNGKTKFHMKIEYSDSGVWTTTRDGQVISPLSLSPAPDSSDWVALSKQYAAQGAVLYSSQWAGWTPVDDCGGGGSVSGAKFTISNLRIYGEVVQGPTPRHCTSEILNMYEAASKTNRTSWA